ncbi:MAG: hypothetical protein JO002_13245, partial [Burkholderiaceae bacterium]|nr:hypothetical protein [Burkholderiaceae bacterium]
SVALADRAGKLLEEMVPSIRTTAELVQEISTASHEQTNGLDQISTTMVQLSQTTQMNASASEELSSTAEQTNAQAVQLQELIQFFKVAGGSLHEAVARPESSRRERFASYAHQAI